MRLRSFVAAFVGAAAVLVSSISPAVAGPPETRCYLQAYRIADLLEAIPGDKPTEQELSQLITTLIAPRSWDSKGGAGTIEYYALTKAFVVNQTPEVQDQVENLLATLRRLAVSEQSLDLAALRAGATRSTAPAAPVVFAPQPTAPFPFPLQAVRGAVSMTAAPFIQQVGAFEKQEVRAEAAKDVQIALEVKILSVPQSCFERIGIDFSSPGVPAVKQVVYPAPIVQGLQDIVAKTSGVAFLNDAQVFTFLEAAQGDVRTTITQTPKLTLLNGQCGTFYRFKTKTCDALGWRDCKTDTPNLPEKLPADATGFHLSVKPVLSADRKYVRLEMRVEQSEKDSCETGCCEKNVGCALCCGMPGVTQKCIQSTVMVPDGGTVLLGGLKKRVETRSEFGPPVLSKIPYVNRLFKNVGFASETQDVLVLVTPRIIVDTTEDAKCPKACGTERCCAVETQSCEPMSRQAKVIAELLKAYDEACADGRTDEAEKFAKAALTIDPTCFRRKR